MKKIIKVRDFFHKQSEAQYSSSHNLDCGIPNEVKDGGFVM